MPVPEPIVRTESAVMHWWDPAVVVAAVAVGAAITPLAESAWRRLRRLRALQRYEKTTVKGAASLSGTGTLEVTGNARASEDLKEEFGQPEVLDTLSRPEPYFYATSLLMANLRCFPHARIDLRFPGEDSNLTLPNVNLLLGDNGSGKSTILRAIAMAALGPVLDSSGFVPYRLVRQGTRQGTIAGSFMLGTRQGPRSLLSNLMLTRRGDLEKVEPGPAEPDWDGLYIESSPSFFIVGYGTNRRVSDDFRADPSQERGRRRRRYQRVSSLFDDSVSLTPLSAWLPQEKEDRKADVGKLFSNLLPIGSHFKGIFDGGEPIFHRNGIDVPLRALSDGFRSYIGWLGDLLYQMNAAAPPGFRLQDVAGIALVDEVDLLLHPSWQRLVVPAISRALPRIQFVFTTHSPIVTGTLQAGNILVCREDRETGTSSVKRLSAEVFGLSSEQVLLSSYFEMDTTRAREADHTLEDLARQAVLGDPDATKEYLRALAHGGLDSGPGPDR
jgi:energy-coupling factor transporter ATP-binding protein EcfA2